MDNKDNNLREELDKIDIVKEKLADLSTPGFIGQFDPDEAEIAGAFVEDALSWEDAMDASIDLDDATE